MWKFLSKAEDEIYETVSKMIVTLISLQDVPFYANYITVYLLSVHSYHSAIWVRKQFLFVTSPGFISESVYEKWSKILRYPLSKITWNIPIHWEWKITFSCNIAYHLIYSSKKSTYVSTLVMFPFPLQTQTHTHYIYQHLGIPFLGTSIFRFHLEANFLFFASHVGSFAVERNLAILQWCSKGVCSWEENILSVRFRWFSNLNVKRKGMWRRVFRRQIKQLCRCSL